MKDWKERFEKFMQDFMYELKTNNSYYQLEHKMHDFIDQIISERDKEIRKEYVDYSTWTCGVCGEENLKGDPTKHKCWEILNDFYNLGKLY